MVHYHVLSLLFHGIFWSSDAERRDEKSLKRCQVNVMELTFNPNGALSFERRVLTCCRTLPGQKPYSLSF